MIHRRNLALRTLLQAALGAAIFLNPLGGLAQTADTGSTSNKSFEAASIKPGDPNTRVAQIQMTPGGRITTKNLPVRNLIMMAYQIRDFQLTGGPDWMRTDRYDIVAKSDDEDATPEQVRGMMQNLLKDRFKLVFHSETKEMPVYNLVIGKNGLKLRETPESELPAPPPGARNAGPAGGRANVRIERGTINGQGMNMELLANQLANQLGRTVINKTGLTKGYDIKLEWTPDLGPGAIAQREGGNDSAPTSAESGPTIFTALQEQLGLKLESTKGPVTIYVVDSLQRPSEN